MSDEMYEDAEEFEVVEGNEALDMVAETMDSLLASATVDAVYGEGVVNGDTMIIPTAEVLAVAGVGGGFGSGTSASEAQEDSVNSGTGGGGGGGGRVLSRPVAVIIAAPEGVRVEPVVDVTKVALAAITAAGFMIGVLAKMRHGPRSMDDY